MDGDKILLAGAALNGLYGLQIFSDQDKAAETFYGQTKPTASEKGVGQWLGFANIANAAMLAVTAGSTDENTRTKVKKVMIATSLAGALIAKNQVDDNGFDKKQADMAIGANLALAAVAARDVFGEKK